MSFVVKGRVIHGLGVGSSLGYPTANVAYETSVALKHGVWAGWVTTDGRRYPAAIIIGADFLSKHPPKFEAHLLDFSGLLYGTLLEVELLYFVRPLRRFAEIEELKAAIVEDLKIVRDYVYGNRQ